MRQAFSDTLIKLAAEDERVVLLTGDHGYALFDEFRRRLPNQYINAGIAEQNMVGMAAGLAKVGMRPIVYGLSAFIPVRVVEQIKIDIAHDSLPVILIGDGAGLVYSHLGTSHQSLEDIAVLRSVPNISICSPSDRFELQASMQFAYNSSSSFYIRMGKADRGDIHASQLISVSELQRVKAGENTSSRLVFLATGSMVASASKLAATHFQDADVYSVPMIHPLATQQLLEIVGKAQLIVTFEEHCESGGLGSAVCEVMSMHRPLRVLRLGSPHRFSAHCGTYEYLLTEHSLDIESLKNKIDRALLSDG
ncbi:transketolase C-terminal domain-containing protein [Variovorax sp. PCZ-1]|uniref:transketolase family protein n=1 Tax=Variovorax sp. PCZ-1 TaxID=2835533 RepID=UPI001BCBD317|nr:transketolase C-terminal domain-containing protein [Variovorax sp. PCZ-1]MBS7808568.1 transketolase [Variovorax sp. PCZ-1]